MIIFSRPAIMIFLLLGAATVAHAENGGDDIVQYATITSLLEGVYDGEMTVAALRRFGDHGIGTFNNLDGEMVQLDGDVYQVTVDGRVHAVAPEMKTPFAVVTMFDADRNAPLPSGLGYDALKAHLDDLVANPNILQAIRIDGVFASVKVRSVPAQTPPYRPLVEVIKDQGVFLFSNIAGTLVGFRIPEYMASLNVPGYHLHFISDDRRLGGHVLDVTTDRGRIAIDESTEFRMLLPKTDAFAGVNIRSHDADALDAVEKAR